MCSSSLRSPLLSSLIHPSLSWMEQRSSQPLQTLKGKRVNILAHGNIKSLARHWPFPDLHHLLHTMGWCAVQASSPWGGQPWAPWGWGGSGAARGPESPGHTAPGTEQQHGRSQYRLGWGKCFPGSPIWVKWGSWAMGIKAKGGWWGQLMPISVLRALTSRNKDLYF